ncbi:MAG: AsmA family protein [Acidobacteria bacterium]|nr:AsmA family protein [Acidobacteriota bacterium]
MKRRLWIGGLALVCAALAVPYFSVGFVRQALQNSLEVALSRSVRIEGKTRLRVLPTPAILADDVAIGEDPAFSLEPFAYVTTLEVSPGLWALLNGRIEATRIRLTEPSVNLMRTATGWNIQSLVSKKLRSPELEVRNGRLNFKQGYSKSPFYLTNALLDLSAVSAQGDARLYFSAEPARTDRGPQGFGAFNLRGSIHMPATGAPTLDFDVELEPSSIHAFNFFFGARGVDFAGKLSGKARVKGPWDQAELKASLQFEGLEPQSFLPFVGKSNQLSLAGNLDIPGQRLSLDTVGGDLLRVRMRAREFFQSPKGGLLVELRQVELAKLLELGREASAKVPNVMSAEGKFNGVIGYSWPSAEDVPARGMIWFSDARLELPEQPRLEIASASVVVEGSRWILSPAEIRVGESQTAAVGAEWNARNGALRLDVATQLLSVKGLNTGLGLLLQASNLPLLSRAQGGSWQGTLQYLRTEDSDPGQWSGRLMVRNLNVELDGTGEPLEVSTASIQFDPNRIAIRKMRAAWDSTEVEGEVTYSPMGNGPAELNLTIAEASASSIARLLSAGQRPRAGLLEKMRLRRSAMPDWLKSRNAIGQLKIKTLQFANGDFQPMQMRFRWKAAKLDATIAATEFAPDHQQGGMQVEGKFSTELWQPAGQMKWVGTLKGWPGEKGPLQLEGAFSSSSIETDWAEHLDGEATVTQPGSESVKLILKQGKATIEFGEGGRKPASIQAPFWPLSIPPEA